MIDYEVGGLLKIQDDISPTLRRVVPLAQKLADQVERIKASSKDLFAGTGIVGFNRQLVKMDPTLSAVARQLERVAAAGDAGLGQVSAAAAAATAAVGALKTELAEAAAAARAIRVPRVVVPGGGGGGRGGGGFVFGGGGGRHGGGRGEGREVQSAMEGRFRPHVGMAVPTGIAAAIGYGAYQQAQVEHVVNRVMLAANERVLGPDLMLNPMSAEIRDIIRQATAATGMSVREAGEALMPVVLQQRGTLASRLSLAPEFERFGFIEKTLKGVSSAEASQALLGLMHMTGAYSPGKIKSLAAGAAFASTVSPLGLPAIERTASYAMPSALAAGISPNDLLLIIAQMQSAGVTSTKSGTWLDALFRSLNPKGGLASMMSTRGGRLRAEALEKLGMLRNGKLIGLDELEQGQWIKFTSTLAGDLAKIQADQRLGVLAEAFGSTQAARAALLLSEPAFTLNLPGLRADQRHFLAGGLNPVIGKLAQGDPTMQFHKTMADFTNALMDLGKVVLPPLTSTLKSIDVTVQSLIPSLPGHKTARPRAADYAKTGLVAGGAAGFAAATLGLTGGLAAGPALLLGAAGGLTVGATYGGAKATERWARQNQLYIDPTTGLAMSEAPFAPHGTPGAVQHAVAAADTKTAAAVHDTGAKTVTELAAVKAAVADAAASIVDAILHSLTGEAVGKAASEYQSHQAAKPPADTGSFDSRLAPLYPSYSGAF